MEINTVQVEEPITENTADPSVEPKIEQTPAQQGQSALQNAKRLTPLEIQIQSYGTSSSMDRLGGKSLSDPGTPEEFKATGPSIGLGPELQKYQEAQVYSYLKNEGLDMETSYSRFQASKYISKRLGLPLGTVVTEFDSIVEDITGVSQDPKKFWENVTDSWKDARTQSEIVKLGNQIRLNPGAESNEVAMQRQEDLKSELSAYDPFEHTIVHDAGGGTASVLPHMIEVGKWVLPGAALMFLTKGGVGKSTVMTGFYVAGQIASMAGGAKAFQEGYDYAAGSIFNDLLDMEDVNGESMDINVARDVSSLAAIPYAAVETMEAVLVMTGTSPMATALKKIGEKKVITLLNKTAVRSMYSLALQGGYRQAAKTLTRTVAPAVLGAAMSYGEEVVEEVVQLQIQIAAEEWAKILVNEMRGTEFAPVGDDEYWDRTITELTEAAKSMFLLQAPGMVKSTISNQLKYNNIANRDKINTELKETDATVQFSENAKTEEFEVLVDEAESQEDKKALEAISTTIETDEEFGITKAVVTSRDGTQQGTVNYEKKNEYNEETKEMDPYISISNVILENESNIAAVENAIAEIKKANPGIDVRFNQELQGLKGIERAVENQNPSVKFLNKSIDEYTERLDNVAPTLAQAEKDLVAYERTLEDDKKFLAENPDEAEVMQKNIAEIETWIADTHTLIEETKASEKIDQAALKKATQQKADYMAKSTAPAYEQTTEEYRETADKADPSTSEFINTPEGAAFATKIHQAIPKMKADEIDAAVQMVELRAAATGKSPQAYIDRWFTEDVFDNSKQAAETLARHNKSRAAVSYDKNGKATFLTGKKTDFTSFTHELAHVFVYQLEGYDFKLATNWTREMAQKTIKAQIARDKKSLSPEEAARREDVYKQELKLMDDGEWTTRMHEAFASGYELFLYTGKANITGMKKIFLRFSEFMRRVYKSAKFAGTKGLVITKEMAYLYQTLLTPDRTAEIKAGNAKVINPIMAQPEFNFQPDMDIDAEYQGLDAYTAYQDEHLAAIYKNTDKESTTYEVKRQKALRTLVDGLKNGDRAFHDPGDFEGRMIMLHPSSREGVKWQMSLFDNYGPQGHYNAVSMADAVSLLRAENFIMENVTGPAETNPLFGGKNKTYFQPMEEEYAQLDTLLEKTTEDINEMMADFDEMIDEDPNFSRAIRETQKMIAQRLTDVETFVAGIKKGVRAFHDSSSTKANSVFLHPSSRAPGKWQMSFFDDRGPYTHMEADTIAWIAKDMTKAQYLKNITEGPHPDSVLAGPKKTMFQPAEEPTSDAFIRWFNDSKVIDENGKAVILHHGTTHDFDAFDKTNANVENDMGRGFYFSNTAADVESNYEGHGPDLSARIESLADSILENMQDDPGGFGFDEDYEVSQADALDYAEKKLAGDNPHVIDVYLSITNPVVLGSATSGMNTKETFFEMDQEVDSDGDFTGEATGSLVELGDALWTAAQDYYDVQIDEVVNELFEDADYEVISASQAIRLLKQTDALQNAMDYDSGDNIASEIIRKAFEIMGFDGIMDFTVNDKFGSRRRIGGRMEGMDEDTFHVIAFDPGSIKEIDNTGTWDRNDPRMMFQPADDINTPAFKEFFKKSEIVNKDGSPKVVYHGTKIDIQGKFKAAFNDGLVFFSTDPKFAGEWALGRQSTDRGKSIYDNIKAYERELRDTVLKEGFEKLNSIDSDDDAWAIEYKKIKDTQESAVKAKYGFKSSYDAERAADSRVYPVYLSIQKAFDPRKDYKLIEDFLVQESGDWILKNGAHKQGSWVIYEKKAVIDKLKELGYDGIWISENIDGPHDTIVPFNAETQVKSQFNTGSWNRDDPRIMFQPSDEQYIASVKKAVEAGYDVPLQVLNQFQDEAWATEEIEKRRQMEDMVPWVLMAQEAESFEAFKAEIQEDGKASAETNKWLEEFYKRATQTPLTADVNVGHKEWLDGLTDEEITRIATVIGEDLDKAREAGYPVSVLAMANRILHKGDVNEKSLRTIRKTFQNNPAKYRLLTAELTGDKALIAKTKKEIELSSLLNIKDETLRDPKVTDRMAIVNELEDVRLKKLIQQGNISTFETERLFNDAEDQLREDEKEIKSLEKQYKTEKSEAVKQAISRANKRRTVHIKELNAKRKLKEHARDIGKYIKRPIPSTIALEQAKQIQAIKDLIDPNFRRKTNAQLKKEILAGELSLTKAFLERIEKRSLGEIPIEELMFIKDTIKALMDFGRAMESIRKTKEADIVKGWIHDLRGGMLQGKEEPIDNAPKTGGGLGKGENAMKLFLATLRPGRIADWIDGGQDFNGVAHRFFIDEVNNAYNEELANRQRREAVIAKFMKDNKITREQLEKRHTVNGVKFSVDEMMDVYAGMKNKLKQEALYLGNDIDQDIANQMEKILTPLQIKLADVIIQEYQDNYERLRRAFRMYTNKELGVEENYTPILRSSWAYAADEIKITQELLSRKSLQKTTPQDGFVNARKEITNKLYQAPIQLGLVSAWRGQVAQQEHYINMGRTISRTNKVLNDSSIKAAAVATGKRPHLIQMQGYIDRVANPSIYKSLRNANGVVKELRNRSAVAYLAFNTVTMLKQVPSLAFYMAYSSPQAFLSAIMEFAVHPKKSMAFVQEKDVQMKDRSIERYLEELKVGHKGKYQHMVDKLGMAGMWGIMFFDKIATTAGWMAVYNTNIQHGLSEEESIRMARIATLNTQPAANAKDIAAIYADDGLLSIFLQFSNQLNQIWNMAVWDAPQALKNKHYMKGLAMYGGMTISAMAMWMITNRRAPEDDEDFFDIWSDQVLATLPIVGRIAAASMDGYDVSIPVITPFTAAGQIMKYGKKGIFNPNDISKQDTKRMLESLHEGLFISTGMPFTATNRLRKGIENDAIVPTVLFGGTWNDQ